MRHLPSHWDPATPTCTLGPRDTLTGTLKPPDSYLHTETMWLLLAHWDPAILSSVHYTPRLLPAHWDPVTSTCTLGTRDTLTGTLKPPDSYLHTDTPRCSYPLGPTDPYQHTGTPVCFPRHRNVSILIPRPSRSSCHHECLVSFCFVCFFF